MLLKKRLKSSDQHQPTLAHISLQIHSHITFLHLMGVLFGIRCRCVLACRGIILRKVIIKDEVHFFPVQMEGVSLCLSKTKMQPDSSLTVCCSYCCLCCKLYFPIRAGLWDHRGLNRTFNNVLIGFRYISWGFQKELNFLKYLWPRKCIPIFRPFSLTAFSFLEACCCSNLMFSASRTGTKNIILDVCLSSTGPLRPVVLIYVLSVRDPKPMFEVNSMTYLLSTLSSCILQGSEYLHQTVWLLKPVLGIFPVFLRDV